MRSSSGRCERSERPKTCVPSRLRPRGKRWAEEGGVLQVTGHWAFTLKISVEAVPGWSPRCFKKQHSATSPSWCSGQQTIWQPDQLPMVSDAGVEIHPNESESNTQRARNLISRLILPFVIGLALSLRAYLWGGPENVVV
jgi:hypothetical protein